MLQVNCTKHWGLSALIWQKVIPEVLAKIAPVFMNTLWVLPVKAGIGITEDVMYWVMLSFNTGCNFSAGLPVYCWLWFPNSEAAPFGKTPCHILPRQASSYPTT